MEKVLCFTLSLCLMTGRTQDPERALWERAPALPRKLQDWGDATHLTGGLQCKQCLSWGLFAASWTPAPFLGDHGSGMKLDRS